MKNSGYILLLVLVLLASVSCGKEKLTPLYMPKTVNQLKNNQPLFFSYKIDDTQIDEYAKNAGKFPIFGKLFKAIAVVLANTTINNDGGHELDLNPIDVDLTSLNDIDLKYIDWIKLNYIKVEIRNSKSKDHLRFIDKIEIYAKLANPPSGAPMEADGYVRLLFFDRKIHSLGCEEKCLEFEQEKLNWKKIIAENKIISIKPKIVINSVPLSTMKLAGSVDFSVKFDIGF
jgi:hypothetical protein